MRKICHSLGRLVLILPFLVAVLPAERVVHAGSLRGPDGIDPARVWDDTSSFYVTNIFDTLVRLDPLTLKIEPSLAVSWETSEDGRTWTFNLRHGVRFHDGTPFNAEAVVFTFFRQMDPANPKRTEDFPLFADIFTYLEKVRRLSPSQVQFVLSEPFFPFLAALTTDCAAIVSPDAVKKAGADFSRQPVGTGPFKLSSWQRDKRLVLRANPEYWRGRPAIDEYVDLIEPQASVLSKNFLNGSLDMIHAYSISKMVSYRKQKWVQVLAAPSLSVTYVVLNAARPPLDRKGVRLALAHAWDPRTLKLVFQDFVLPIHTLLPRGLIGVDPPGPAFTFSLELARSLLKKEKLPSPLQLEMLLLNEDGLLFQLLSFYAANLKQIGVRLKLTRLERTDLARRVAAGDFDLAYSGWIADYPDPDTMLFPLLSEQLQRQGLPTITAAGRRDLSDLLAKARHERDAGKRLAIYKKIDRAVVTDGLVVPMYQDKKVIVYSHRIAEIQPNPLGKLVLFDMRIK
ncbi:MAG: hypothetical protein JXO51_08950 [Candidatus Aminicenantes bacterium]|nr:hypothetical protein [Candidatus Aminicenantes bacterium]